MMVADEALRSHRAVDRDDKAPASLRQRGAASDYDDSEVFMTSRREYEPRYDVEVYAAGDPL